MNNPLKGKIPPLGLKVELKAGEEYLFKNLRDSNTT